MRKQIILSFLALLAAAALAAFSAGPAFALEPDEVEASGVVVFIDAANNLFVVETGEGETLTVYAPEGFDFTALAEGDFVEVTGTSNEDGSIAATGVKVELPEEEPIEEPDEEPVDEPGEETPADGFYCQQSEQQHPFGARLAERYGVDYATLQAWFCDGQGWGQIMLALQTGQVSGDDPGALLEERRGGAGWGQIWQERKLIGKRDQAGPPTDEDEDGLPDYALTSKNKGTEKQNEEQRGRPDHAGPPDDEDGDGRPDHAGPPAGKGPKK